MARALALLERDVSPFAGFARLGFGTKITRLGSFLFGIADD